MKTILKYMKPYNIYILFTLLLKFGASMMDLLIPSLLAKIIDDIVPLGEVRLIFWWGGGDDPVCGHFRDHQCAGKPYGGDFGRRDDETA